MPFHHHVLKDQGWAEVVAEGNINVMQSVNAMTVLASDTDFNAAFNVLVDLRPMKFSIKNSDVRIIAARLGSMRKNFQGKVAIVVSGDFYFGMARMTCFFAELAGFRMVPFRDYNTAQQWICGETGAEYLTGTSD